MRFLSYVLVAFVGLSGCDEAATSSAAASSGDPGGGGAGGSKPVDPHPAAHAAFWDTFYAARYDDKDGAVAELEAAFESDPTNHQTALLLGLSSLWGLAENDRDPDFGPGKAFAYHDHADTYFRKALELDPSDLRPWAWLGAVKAAIGNNAGDPDLAAEGMAMIPLSAPYSEAFATYITGIQYDSLPASDPDFAIAVESMWTVFDFCVGGTLNRDNPDYTPYMSKENEADGALKDCWSIPVAPHNFEALHFYMADLLTKQGKIEAAKVFLDNATLSESYDSWPFRAKHVERLGEDLAARAALYQDADDTNDPEYWDSGWACAGCHAQSIP